MPVFNFMKNGTSNPYAARFEAISEYFGAAVIAVGTVALAGWVLDIPVLKSFYPGFADMKANTAAGFIITGAAILILHPKRNGRPARFLGTVFAAAVFLLGALTFAQYFFNVDIGIDRALFPDPGGAPVPGRMTLNSCLCFILTGMSLLLLDRGGRSGCRPAQYLILLEGLIALVALNGYLYVSRNIYGIPLYTHMALPSAAAFMAVCFAVLFLRPGSGVMEIFSAGNVGGFVARRLIFLSLAIPLAAEMAVEAGRLAGLYDRAYAASLHTVLVVICLTALIYLTARLLGRVEDSRRALESRFQKSEGDYRDLVEGANSIILRMDLKGNIVFFNRFAQEFFGYREEEILGKNAVGTIVPATDASGHDLREMIDDIAANPKKYMNNENENMLRDGRRVWIAWTNRPVFDAVGMRMSEVLCVGNDITRLKEAEAELRRAKELAETACMAGTVMCGPDWKIREMNLVARGYFDLEGRRVEGEDILRIMGESYNLSAPADEIADPSRTRRVFDLVRPETKDNNPLYLQVSVEFVRNPLRELTGIVMVMQDVTQLRQEEKMKQDFLGFISHKLRTPLAVISGNAGLLPEVTGEKQRKCAAVIVKETEQLGGLIEELLRFSEINRMSVGRDVEEIDLSQYVPLKARAAVENVRGRKAELKIDCPDSGCVIRIDRQALDLIIENLIENAVKFNDKDVVKVSVSVKSAGQRVDVTVIDNGRGIPPEESGKIFEQFHQIEKYFTGQTAGAGLGLSLVKRLVIAFGGQICFDSEIGRGTAFFLSFPFRPEPHK